MICGAERFRKDLWEGCCVTDDGTTDRGPHHGAAGTGRVRGGRAGWRRVASLGTWLSALVIVAVAVASIVAGHGVFALGVGIMLLIYAALLGLVGWAAHRGAPWSDGLLIASSLLHIAVVVTMLRSGAPVWFLALLLVAVAVLVAAVMLVLGRRTAA